MRCVAEGNAERVRLAEADAGTRRWRAWGPYLSERAWGTVREDYSDYGAAWDYFPHDHARSRVYRWSEDGLAGICDDRQTFCFALALWNGEDAILKERIFGVAGPEGNHGEDAKEYWWYLDSTPTHSFMRWRYHYPQAAFPYDELSAVNRERGRDEPEYELVDTGIFADDRYFAVTVDYAKASPTDLAIRITVHNRGPEPATLHLLPTLWFRNTWSWGLPGRDEVPRIEGRPGRLVATHHRLGRLVLDGAGEAEPLLCDNETNSRRLWGLDGARYPKDGINDHVVHGADTVNPDRVGTKGALHYQVEIGPGASTEIRLRLALVADAAETWAAPDAEPDRLDLGDAYTDLLAVREAEADEYFAELVPATAGADEALVVRQAVAGLMWSKQFYHYDVARWLDGDPASVPPPDGHKWRNSHWRHMSNFDVISMPDPWEYPWYAAWDLAFQAVAIARVDPTFAKQQLLLLLREWYLHPNGQIPAYEWAFDDVNPPVHGWAALKVFELDGGTDTEFLAKMLHKLLLNFTWWVNRKDAGGNNVFEGGFLGLDNVGPFDRSAALPVAGVLEQSDATAWMAMYALNLLEMAVVLSVKDSAYVDLATKFLEHFAWIASAAYEQGLWDEQDGFFYDVLRPEHGEDLPMRVRSVVGLLPLAATTVLGSVLLNRLPAINERLRWFDTNRPEYADVIGHRRVQDGQQQRLLAAVGPDQLVRVLARMLDEAEFLSRYGLRSLSRAHLDEPFTVTLADTDFTVGYEPGESTNAMFGGNSNWRGPVWFPVNYLIIDGLRRYATFFGDDLKVEYPTGSGDRRTLGEIADDLSRRLVDLFLAGEDKRRPMFGDCAQFQDDPNWRDLLLFYEFFHGDTGGGLGASHQTGWTALVADLILTLHERDGGGRGAGGAGAAPTDRGSGDRSVG
ncbi:MAG TPA: glucosidase [Micromonosporaceae bacterium]